MSEFKKYKRESISELREVTNLDIVKYKTVGSLKTEGGNIISISEFDIRNGSPKIGDMIARNLEDNDDQWLVAKNYFNKNFKNGELR